MTAEYPALDLRQLAAFRAQADAWLARLQAGDETALPAARSLLDHVADETAKIRTILTELNGGQLDLDVADAIGAVIDALAVGDLGVWVDWVMAKPSTPQRIVGGGFVDEDGRAWQGAE